jgi:flagellar hook-associated protein 3 FlgL
MPFRITDTPSGSRIPAYITASKNSIATIQERLATGKKINRPSDDPAGTETVIEVRNAQGQVEQFRRNASAARSRLSTADSALDSYETTLDRVRVLFSQGTSGFTQTSTKLSIAAELDAIRTRLLSIANTNSEGVYIFGGTRQSAPPYDPTTAAPAAGASTDPLIQIEPNAPAIIVGVTSESVFADANGTIYDTIANVAAALRGTGDPVADDATIAAGADRVRIFQQQSSYARAKIGIGLSNVDAAIDRLDSAFVSLETSANQVEASDFARDAILLNGEQNTLDAIIKSAAIGRRSLLDILA